MFQSPIKFVAAQYAGAISKVQARLQVEMAVLRQTQSSPLFSDTTWLSLELSTVAAFVVEACLRRRKLARRASARRSNTRSARVCIGFFGGSFIYKMISICLRAVKIKVLNTVASG
jgi:hypothetical protein